MIYVLKGLPGDNGTQFLRAAAAGINFAVCVNNWNVPYTLTAIPVCYNCGLSDGSWVDKADAPKADEACARCVDKGFTAPRDASKAHVSPPWYTAHDPVVSTEPVTRDPNHGMTPLRYEALMADTNGQLTPSEYLAGWWFCIFEWDGLLVHSSWLEGEICKGACNCQDNQLPPQEEQCPVEEDEYWLNHEDGLYAPPPVTATQGGSQ